MNEKQHRSAAVTVLLWAALFVYLVILFRLILFKFPVSTILDILNDQDELEYTRVNLVPFQTIRFYMLSGTITLDAAVSNLFGNILAFFPLGVLVPLIRQKPSVFATFVIAALLSFSIEFIQLVTGLGSCDIDDIILNVFGAMLTCLVLASLDFFEDLLDSLIRKLK